MNIIYIDILLDRELIRLKMLGNQKTVPKSSGVVCFVFTNIFLATKCFVRKDLSFKMVHYIKKNTTQLQPGLVNTHLENMENKNQHLQKFRAKYDQYQIRAATANMDMLSLKDLRLLLPTLQ